MKQEPEKNKPGEVDHAWERATRLFANYKAMRVRLSWLTAVSIDTGADRVQRLLREKRAAALHAILSELDAAGLRNFLQRAEVNLERAAAAMRLNLVVNISIPVGALVIVNQLFPQLVSEFIARYGTDAVTMTAATVVLLVLFSIWYSYSCVTQARDLAHLTKLYSRRASGMPPAANNYDDEPLNPAELA